MRSPIVKSLTAQTVPLRGVPEGVDHKEPLWYHGGMTIRDALREASKRAGWSPTKVAAEVGVTEKTAKKWLSGEADPRVEQFIALRKVLPGFAELLDRAVA